MVKFSAQGTCMYPCVHPKDTLCIEPKNAKDIEIGDIAVYRRYNSLLAHRTIDKGKDGNLNYIVTRPDTVKCGNDGRTFDEDILGIISRIERKGNILSPKKKEHSLTEKIFLNLILKWFYLKRYLFTLIIYIITYMQQFKAYRRMAKYLFLKNDDKMAFSINVPLNHKATDRFYKLISPEELVILNSHADKESISNWNITLNIGSKQAAYLSFVYKPKNCPFSGWWMSNAKISMRYRGTKVEEKFLQRIDELLRQSGISQIYISIFKNAYFDKMVFKSMGFKQISSFRDDFVRGRNNKAIERLVMERKI
ncbi:MAG: hypothetical protein PHF11_01450 [Candidatus Omnitrophica bacterium]|nr:hypothetical protein [Candidatus Omnitrophota bacterium]